MTFKTVGERAYFLPRGGVLARGLGLRSFFCLAAVGHWWDRACVLGQLWAAVKAMLWLMTDENATPAGANPGAVMNEVMAVTNRLIGGLLETPDNCPVSLGQAFESNLAMKAAVGKLRNGTNVHRALGHNVIRRYLGQGRAERLPRSTAALVSGASRISLASRTAAGVTCQPSRLALAAAISFHF